MPEPRESEKKAKKKHSIFIYFLNTIKKEFFEKRKSENENVLMNNLQCKFSTQIKECSLEGIQTEVQNGIFLIVLISENLNDDEFG